MCYKANLHSRGRSVSILIVLLFFVFFDSLCQPFDPGIKATHWTIDGKVRQGFSTDFEFSAKEVEKGWWRHSRNFGRPLNMKTYYQVTIPSGASQGNVDIQLFARVVPGKNGSTFFLTLNGDNIPESKQKDYLSQVKTILQDFKMSFYLSRLEKVLQKEEKKAKKLSKKVDRADDSEKEDALNALSIQEDKLETLRQKVKLIYNAY